jgi:hypothetical protein
LLNPTFKIPLPLPRGPEDVCTKIDGLQSCKTSESKTDLI